MTNLGEQRLFVRFPVVNETLSLHPGNLAKAITVPNPLVQVHQKVMTLTE